MFDICTIFCMERRGLVVIASFTSSRFAVVITRRIRPLPALRLNVNFVWKRFTIRTNEVWGNIRAPRTSPETVLGRSYTSFSEKNVRQ